MLLSKQELLIQILTIDLYQVTESKVSTKPFRMPYIGIANIEYINNISSSPAPVLSTKKFGATFAGGDFKRYQEVEGLRIKGQLIEPDAEISIYYDENGNLIDDRLDPEEAIHFAGVKLAKLIKSVVLSRSYLLLFRRGTFC